MKVTLAIALFAALSITGCRKPEVVVSPPQTPAPVPAATPPPPPERHLAPEGVFYLVTAVRVETHDGITGLPPGTGVKLVRPGVYLTPAGEISLDASQITNDLDVARQVRDAAVAAKDATLQWRADEQQKAAIAAAAASREATATHNSQLNEIDRQNLAKKLDALRQRKAELQTELSNLAGARGRENVGRVFGRIESNSSGDAMAGVRAELRQVNAQIMDTQRALRGR